MVSKEIIDFMISIDPNTESERGNYKLLTGVDLK